MRESIIGNHSELTAESTSRYYTVSRLILEGQNVEDTIYDTTCTLRPERFIHLRERIGGKPATKEDLSTRYEIPCHLSNIDVVDS